MHYYTFDIGNYRRQTGHLTLIEHGIYRSLIDTYYLREVPFDTDLEMLMRSLRILTDDEKTSFGRIIFEYFTLTDDGYRHSHCDEVLGKIYSKSKKAKEAADTRWRNEKDRRASKLHQNRIETASKVDQKNADASNNNANASICNTDASKNDADAMLLTTNNSLLITQDKRLDREILDRLLERFWSAGMRKVGKKKFQALFKKVIAAKTNQEEFVDWLIEDVEKRLKSGQLGFAEMHPSTYFNGERWTDERTNPIQPKNNQSSEAEMRAHAAKIGRELDEEEARK